MVRGKPRHRDLPYSPLRMRVLANLLDTINRVHDNETTVIDVYAIVFATAVAMEETDLHEPLLSASEELLTICRTTSPGSQTARDQAFVVTETLRGEVPHVG